MIDSDTLRLIREEVKRQVNIVLNAAAGANDTQTETINDLFPGMPGITGRPVMHPFGFVSRANQGTISVTVRVGDHSGNRMVIGHRDKGRPADLAEGETTVYSSGGTKVELKLDRLLMLIASGAEMDVTPDGITLKLSGSDQLKIMAGMLSLTSDQVAAVASKVTLGSAGASSPVPLGDQLQSILSSLAGLISSLAGQCAGIPGLSPPQILAFTATGVQATTLQGMIDSGAFLSEVSFTE